MVTNTQYAVAFHGFHSGKTLFVLPSGKCGSLHVSEAQTFDTLTGAALFTGLREFAGDKARIVRVVTETTTTEPQESQRVLGETEEAQEGETVLYALWDNYAWMFLGHDDSTWVSDIKNARLFRTHAEVLKVVCRNFDPGCTIRRIAVGRTPGETTTTYRVEEIV